MAENPYIFYAAKVIIPWRILNVIVFVILFLSLLTPFIIRLLFIKKFTLSSNETELFNNWQTTPIPIYTRFYFFHIENPGNYFYNNFKPVLKELGPYTFIEMHHKLNISWNHSEGTISYQQKKNWTFVPELSNGQLSDSITHLNVALASLISKTKKEANNFTYYLTNSILANYEDIFLNHTIGELLFDGFENDLLEWIQKIGYTNDIPDKEGFFYKKNNTPSKEIYSVFTGETHHDELNLLQSWNGLKRLPYWKSEACNQIKGTWPGGIRPNYLDKLPDFIDLFVPELCRSLKLHLLGKSNVIGINTYRYGADQRIFNYSYAENRCYCINECPHDGIYFQYVCANDAPVSSSLPHFLFADPTYNESFIGLESDLNRHKLYMDIETDLGIVVNSKIRLQANVLIDKDDKIDFTNGYDKSLHFPMFWFEVSSELDEKTALKLSIFQSGLTLSRITSWIMGIIFSISSIIICILYPRIIKKLEKIDKEGPEVRVRLTSLKEQE